MKIKMKIYVIKLNGIEKYFTEDEYDANKIAEELAEQYAHNDNESNQVTIEEWWFEKSKENTGYINKKEFLLEYHDC